MDKRLRLTLLFLILAAALGLSLAYRYTIRDVILVPLLYLFWLGGLLLRSLDQRVIWAGLVLIVVVIGLRSLPRTRGGQGDAGQQSTQRNGDSRLLYWAHFIRAWESGVVAPGFAQYHFRKLILDILADRENLSPDQVQERLARGDLEAPPALVRYLAEEGANGAQTRSAGQARNGVQGLRPYVKKWLRLWGRQETGQPQLQQDLENILRFLEDELEIQHELEHQ